MRLRRLTAAVAGIAIVAVLPAPAAAGRDTNSDRLSWTARSLGRQALPPNDGWAAAGAGTTGAAGTASRAACTRGWIAWNRDSTR